MPNPFDPANHSIDIHCAPEDSQRAMQSVDMLVRLGFKVTEQRLPVDSDLVRSATRSPILTIFFRSNITQQSSYGSLLDQHTIKVSNAGQKVVLALLDTDCEWQATQEMPDGYWLQLPIHAIDPFRVQLRLTSRVLDAIDNQLDTTYSEDSTIGLARSLQVSCAGQQIIVPLGFAGLVTIGRSPSCQIQIDSSLVSRMHGCIRCVNGAFSYRDMSQNGTILNHKHDEILVHNTEVELTGNGTLRLGDASVAFANID